MSRLPKDPEERLLFIERALTDTGFFARNVLGMDTDRDSNGNATSQVGKGGIRDYGPHQEMVRFLDDDSKLTKVLWAPRYSYKSSLAKAFLTRMVLARPNIAILLYMHDFKEAEERAAQIRDSLLENEIIAEMFGDLKGPVWQRGAWTTSLRSDMTIQQPTLTIASPKKAKTGGRYNLILFDDLVSETSYLTDAGRREGIRCVEKSLNLRARGTRYVGIGTPYHPGDANHWMVNAGWQTCTNLDVGCDLVVKQDGTLDLAGEARWPNLGIDFLRGYLKDGMSYELFMSQFKLKVVAGMTQAFQAHQFQPVTWKDSEHSDLTGYLLTDVAPSGSQKGDHNVLAYIGIDDRQRIYVLDLELGFWKMHEFCTRYLAMLSRWDRKVTHRAELWEDSLSFHSYFQYLQIESKKTKQNLSVERQRRNQHERSKDERIAGLALRFQAKEVFVMDTIPRTWNTGTEVRELWHPEGERDPITGKVLPTGDLVDWFVRFPHHPKKDVPDTLALADATDRKTEQRICYWVRSSRYRVAESRQKLADQQARRPVGRGSATRFYDRCYSRDDG